MGLTGEESAGGEEASGHGDTNESNTNPEHGTLLVYMVQCDCTA